ncbi:hypothetical protein C3V36_04445 [Lachnospiraceae bacterium oral taxon 500]|nr:hypothetical protein C3V36_04445 [Lachnospiraceae bacterium oral taxon 500]
MSRPAVRNKKAAFSIFYPVPQLKTTVADGGRSGYITVQDSRQFTELIDGKGADNNSGFGVGNIDRGIKVKTGWLKNTVTGNFETKIIICLNADKISSRNMPSICQFNLFAAA